MKKSELNIIETEEFLTFAESIGTDPATVGVLIVDAQQQPLVWEDPDRRQLARDEKQTAIRRLRELLDKWDSVVKVVTRINNVTSNHSAFLPDAIVEFKSFVDNGSDYIYIVDYPNYRSPSTPFYAIC